MDYRHLGRSGWKVPVLALGTATWGGSRSFGNCAAAEAARLVDIALDAGVTMIDSADVYAQGVAEEILGRVIQGRRERVILSTKGGFRTGAQPNDAGASRYHLTNAVEASLRRLGTDCIDLYQVHAFDALTPIDETLHTLSTLVNAGKIRYLGCSNFAAWQLMKSLAVADRLGLERYVAHQAYYSLVGRDYEWELMPLALDQGVGTIVWSPLGWGRLTGRIRRDAAPASGSRMSHPHHVKTGPPVADDVLHRVVDALAEVAREIDKTVPQVAIRWLLHRPTVASVIVGARNEVQLRENLGAAHFSLAPHQLRKLEEASASLAPYPHWHQRRFCERNEAAPGCVAS
jgi:aryl-alcohol dehydrogenase-like predicted oxidoreductase